ncbi:MAG: hypothetical protein KAH77_09125 [Thiomargarita sp.]|nr:hypothetical protein [Thiomargarita sp.]
MLTQKQKRNTQLIKLFLWGVMVIMLYIALYLGETPLVNWIAHGHWNFIGPIVIAFIFSFVHGHFTGEFWNVLGIKPKLSGGQK